MRDLAYLLPFQCNLQEIWPNCEEFLSTLSGSEVDHSLLLCNYLTSLGKKAYLVLGRSVGLI